MHSRRIAPRDPSRSGLTRLCDGRAVSLTARLEIDRAEEGVQSALAAVFRLDNLLCLFGPDWLPFPADRHAFSRLEL